jgi:anthranilate phosphoribosyltransferase
MNQLLTWPNLMGKLLLGSDLSRAESSWVMQQIMSGEATEAQMAGFMIGLRAKGETVDEISGLVDVMLEHALKLTTGNDALDIVGTGGDLVGTFNVSSMASILSSAAGIPVLKHGSRSASGKTGSSEMFEVLGVNLDLTPDQVAEVFKKTGITFFFAPVFHPALRFVGPVRRQLGVPTTFNFLGPLANPAQPVATSLGVANADVAPLIAAEMAARGRTALVFRGDDGLDELTTTAKSRIWQVSGGVVREFTLDPRDFGISLVAVDDLVGGDAEFNAQVARDVFARNLKHEDAGYAAKIAAAIDIVRLNAAAGVVAYELARDASRADVDLNLRFEDALAKVTLALESGAAEAKLSAWVTASQSV